MQIYKAIDVLKEAERAYTNGDAIRAIWKLEDAEKMIRKIRVKLCVEVGKEGYDAIILK